VPTKFLIRNNSIGLRSMTSQKKIALVTGANKGVGFKTCSQLAQVSLYVILRSRDITKGDIAEKH